MKEDVLKEECGVFGVYNKNFQKETGQMIYYGLYSLQHRGQESCGIAVIDDTNVKQYKDMGLVPEVFNDQIIGELTGSIGIGHVRYSTAGGSLRQNAQPLVSKYLKGALGISHNGNLTNAFKLREEFENKGYMFQTSIDSEVIATVIATERVKQPSVEAAVSKMMEIVEGSYSLLVMSPKKLIACRDPHGFRPLAIGKIDDTYVVSSETCGLDAVGATYIRDVEPGEIVVIDENGLRSITTHCKKVPSSLCIFEYIYFARPDSVIDGVSVYEARKRAGRKLAQEHPVEGDIVIGVPDSGMSAALGYAEESGIPYGDGLIKNRYIGRTFISPTQSKREDGVRVKLNALKANVEGKRVIMIDDSIVRGTTIKRLVKILREAGAKEIHMRVSAPPFLWPCYYGTDVPSRDKLVAVNHTVEEIAEMSGLDSLGYLGLEKLTEIAEGCSLGFCDSCFSGKYPTKVEVNNNEEEKSNEVEIRKSVKFTIC